MAGRVGDKLKKRIGGKAASMKRRASQARSRSGNSGSRSSGSGRGPALASTRRFDQLVQQNRRAGMSRAAAISDANRRLSR